MAENLGTLVYKISGDISEFNSSVDEVNKKTAALTNTLSGIGKGLTTFVTLPILAIGTASVKAAADMEMLQSNFEVMLGSASRATKLVNDIKKMAASTPFSNTDLANASKTLLQFGINAEKIIPTLKMIGDVSGGNAQRFSQLSLAFGQMSSSGRLMGQDLMQMINAGFNPLNEIAKKTGESMAELKDRMSKGKVTVDEVTGAFESATSAGGMFFNGMEKSSKTFSGLWSTMLDDISELGRTFGEILLPTLKEVVKQISKWAQDLNKLDNDQKKMIITIAAVAASIGPVLIGVSKLITILNTLKVTLTALQVAGGGPVALAIAGIAALTVGMYMLGKEIENQKKKQEEWQKAEGLSIEATKQRIKSAELGVKAYEVALKKAQDQQNSRAIEVATDKLKFYQEALANAKAELIKLEKAAADAAAAAEKAANPATTLDITKERAKIEKAYAEAVAKTNKLKQDGLITEQEARDRLLKALEDELAALKELYSLTTNAPDLKNKIIEQQKAYDELNGTINNNTEILSGGNKVAVENYIAMQQKNYDAVKKLKEEEEKAKEEREKATLFLKDKAIPVIDAVATGTENITTALIGQDNELVRSINIWKNWIGGFARIGSGDYIGGTLAMIQALSDAIEESTQGTVKALEKETDLQLKTLDLQKKITQEKLDAINIELENKLDAIDKAEQAELKSRGLLDKTKLELLQEQLDKETDENKKATIEKEISKQQIEDKYEEQRIKAQEAANAAEKQLKRELAEFEKQMTILNIKLDKAKLEASAKTKEEKDAIKNILPLYDDLIAQVSGMPVPNFASGGIVYPTAGGTLARVAEAGEPEIIAPLSKLNDVVSKYSNLIPSVGDTGDINLKVLLDSKPILEKIFPATKNKTVLISASAVVA